MRQPFFYPKNTFGKGASYSWKGSDGEGNSKTIAVSDNQSIHQKLNYNSTTADVYWTFKDTVGGTKVTWESKGTMKKNSGNYSKVMRWRWNRLAQGICCAIITPRNG